MVEEARQVGPSSEVQPTDRPPPSYTAPMDARPSASTPAPDRTETWTTQRLLAWMADRFRQSGLDSPRLSAEMLLSHVLGCSRLALYTDAARPASEMERGRLRELVTRALRHEPIQYLVAEAWFFALPLTVSPEVLIPRPSTESLVEEALDWLRAEETSYTEQEPPSVEPARRPTRIADIGTGSGAIAIALAVNRPEARLVATDVSREALGIARRNAQRHTVSERIDFREGNLLAPFDTEESFDLVVSNPPYISDEEWPAVAANVREHEPALALRAGSQGLDVIEPLLAGVPGLLRPGGLLLVEHAASHADAVRHIAAASGELVSIETKADLEGLPRYLRAVRRPPVSPCHS